MGIDFDAFNKTKAGKIKKRKETIRKTLNISIVVFFVITFSVLILQEFFSFLKNNNLSAYIFLLSLAILILILSFTDKIKVTFKENILLYLSEAEKYLSKFIKSGEDKELNKSRKYFKKVVNKTGDYISFKHGFDSENEINDFITNLKIYIEKEVIPKLNIDLNEKEYKNIYNNLLDTFIALQDEDFKKLNELFVDLTKKYASAKIKIGPLLSKITSSNKLFILVLIIIITMLDLLGLGLFSLLGKDYSHTAAIVIIIAFLAVLKPFHDFLKSISEKTKN